MELGVGQQVGNVSISKCRIFRKSFLGKYSIGPYPYRVIRILDVCNFYKRPLKMFRIVDRPWLYLREGVLLGVGEEVSVVSFCGDDVS